MILLFILFFLLSLMSVFYTVISCDFIFFLLFECYFLIHIFWFVVFFFFFQAEDGIRDIGVTGVQTCALPIFGVCARAARRAIRRRGCAFQGPPRHPRRRADRTKPRLGPSGSPAL